MEQYPEKDPASTSNKEFQEITSELNNKPTNLPVYLEHYGINTVYTFSIQVIMKLAMHCPSQKIVEFITTLKGFCLVKSNANENAIKNLPPNELTKNLYNRFKRRYKNLDFNDELKSKHISRHLFVADDLLFFHEVFSHFIQQTSLNTTPRAELTPQVLKTFGITNFEKLSLFFQHKLDPDIKSTTEQSLCELELAIENNKKYLKILLDSTTSIQSYVSYLEKKLAQFNPSNTAFYPPDLETMQSRTTESNPNDNNHNFNQQNTNTSILSPITNIETPHFFHHPPNESSAVKMDSLQNAQTTQNLLEQSFEELSIQRSDMQNANSINKISTKQRLQQSTRILEKSSRLIINFTKLFNSVQNCLHQLQQRVNQLDLHTAPQPTYQKNYSSASNKKPKSEGSYQHQAADFSFQNQQTMNAVSPSFFPNSQNSPSPQQEGTTSIKSHKTFEC